MFNLNLKSRNKSLQYTVAHRPRVTKRLHLELDQSGGLVIVAPKHWSGALIKRTVAQNTGRISRFMARATRQQLAPLIYEEAANHLYLGQYYPLTMSERNASDGAPHGAGDFLGLQVTNTCPVAVKTSLIKWYRQSAMLVFRERLQLLLPKATWVRQTEIPLSVRRMKRTWGNCSSSGRIKLNVHLIKAPLEIVDSVIAHELCHLTEMNHGKRFYALLEALNPDWHHHRTILRANGHRYLQE